MWKKKKDAGSLDMKSWHAVTFLHKCGRFSARPLISQVYFGHALVPEVPFYSTSLHLDLTNCSPSHNTLSAFNYCLEVSGSRVTHSTGSLCGSVGAACVRVSIECAECPLYDDRGIEGSAEFHCAFSFFYPLAPPRSSRIAHP